MPCSIFFSFVPQQIAVAFLTTKKFLIIFIILLAINKFMFWRCSLTFVAATYKRTWSFVTLKLIFMSRVLRDYFLMLESVMNIYFVRNFWWFWFCLIYQKLKFYCRLVWLLTSFMNKPQFGIIFIKYFQTFSPKNLKFTLNTLTSNAIYNWNICSHYYVVISP